MNEIDKLAWLLIRDNQILVARTKNKDTYYIPGGKRERGEDDHQALIREIKEELLVDLDPTSISYIGTFEAPAHEKSDGNYVKMTCYSAAYSGELTPNAEIEEIRWLGYHDQAKCSPVTKKIITWLHDEKKI